MEKDQHKDEFIRKLIAQQPPVKAPGGFTDRVMGKLQPEAGERHEPILSPLAWGAIIAGIAALIITLFVIDIPFISNFFSSTGIQQLSFNIFNTGFYDSFVRFFKELNVNAIGIIIVIAFISLIVVERIISRKRAAQKLIML